jgi:ribonuclease P/MRP protein subunit RPP40
MDHLIKNNLLRDSQRGFMPGHSCATNLISFLDSLTKARDRGKAVDIIYLDFRKAFDKVTHQHLLRKLEAKGVSREVTEWIADWLSERTQRVKINDVFSMCSLMMQMNV